MGILLMLNNEYTLSSFITFLKIEKHTPLIYLLFFFFGSRDRYSTEQAQVLGGLQQTWFWQPILQRINTASKAHFRAAWECLPHSVLSCTDVCNQVVLRYNSLTFC